MNNTNITPIEEDEIDLSQLFRTLRKYTFFIIFVTLLVTTAAVAYAYFAKPVYTSDVSISFSDEKSNKLTAIIPDDLSGTFGSTEKELETVKLTLETRKFIENAIKDLPIDQRYYVEHNFRKNALYTIEELDIDLNIHDEAYRDLKKETLYGQYFQITPKDEKQYLLTIKALEFSRLCNFGEKVSEKDFTLRVKRKGEIEKETNYFVTKTESNKIADEILHNLTTSILSENVLKLTYNDSTPRRAKEIVETLAKSFRSYTLEKKTTEINQTLAFLNREIDKIEKVLKGKGKNLKEYQVKKDTFLTIESNNIALFQNITQKKELIKEMHLQLVELKNFKRALKQNQFNTISLLNSGIQISSIQSLIELFRKDGTELTEMRLQAQNIGKSITQNAQLSRLILNLNEKRKLLKELRFNFTEDHPQVQKAISDYKHIKSDIKHYINVNIHKLQTNRLATKRKILHNIITTEQNIKTKLKMLKGDVSKEQALLKTLPEKSFDIQELKRKFSFSEKTYTFLLQKKIEMEISLASTITNTQIIENAREAFKSTKPNRKLIIIVGSIIGLILGIFLAFLRAMMDNKIRDEATIRELTDAPVYGVLPNKSQRRFFKEALRNIRTNIQFVLKNDKECTTLLISSTIPGEGKTTVIAGLADVMAQTEKRVLIMDLDLRKPRLYQELKKSNKQGMTQYLSGDLELSDCIQPITDNLDFFPAGAVPPNPSELLMSNKFKEAIDKLQEQYDYILFDTSPIGSVIDANILLEYANIVLLIVRANVAHKIFIEKFNLLRKEKEIASSGIILNALQENGATDDYGYGYGYGYGSEKSTKKA